MKKTCVFSVIFPANLAYFDDFLTSLSNQDFKDFDLVLLNDGVQNLKPFTDKYSSLNFKVYPVTGSPAEIREKGIELLANSTYEKIIFSDTDDYFSNNRVSLSLQLLEKNDVVVNEITLVSADKLVLKENYFSQTLNDNEIFDNKFLSDKNILGLSNTAINKKILSKIEIATEIVAVDWFLFTTLFAQRKLNGIFSNKAITFYRQHEANTVGIGTVTEQGILNAIRVKLIHYKNLSHLDNMFVRLSDKFEILNAKLKDAVFRQSYIAYIYSLNLKNPLWWEEAKEF